MLETERNRERESESEKKTRARERGEEVEGGMVDGVHVRFQRYTIRV